MSVCLALFLVAAAGVTGLPQTYRVQIARPEAIVYVTAAAIEQRITPQMTTLYLLTAARPFRLPMGERLRPPHAVVVWLNDVLAVDVDPEDVVLPAATLLDIAIVRVALDSARTDLRLAPLTCELPAPGATFRVVGSAFDGRPAATVDVGVRFESTALLVGDRDISSMDACVGAPAVSEAGIFGVVSRCERGSVPLVSLLGLAREFMQRAVPGQRSRPTVTR